MKNLDIITTYDGRYTGYYVDGKLELAGHTINDVELLSLLIGKDCRKTEFRRYVIRLGWLQKVGVLPTNFEKLPSEAIIVGGGDLIE